MTLEHLPRDHPLGHARHYSKGMEIWQPGDPANRVYFLERGQVAEMASDREGRELILRVIEPGEPFGELCFCVPGEGRRQTTARAVIDSQAVEIHFEEFIKFLQRSRDALVRMIFTFCVRLTEADRRLEILALRHAEERLGRLLLYLAHTRGRPVAEHANEMEVPVSHEELASMAAMSRPHVTVTMGKLRRRGLLTYGRGRPVLVDMPSLDAYLNS